MYVCVLSNHLIQAPVFGSEMFGVVKGGSYGIHILVTVYCNCGVCIKHPWLGFG